MEAQGVAPSGRQEQQEAAPKRMSVLAQEVGQPEAPEEAAVPAAAPRRLNGDLRQEQEGTGEQHEA